MFMDMVFSLMFLHPSGTLFLNACSNFIKYEALKIFLQVKLYFVVSGPSLQGLVGRCRYG